MAALDHTRADLASLAAAEFALRRAQARRMVADRKLDPEAAARRLAPWLALACYTGADLPELVESIAALRVDQLGAISSASDTGCTERQARAQLADEISPRGAWRAELARVRDQAIVQAEANPAALPRARALCVLAARLAPHIPTTLRLDGAGLAKDAARCA